MNPLAVAATHHGVRFNAHPGTGHAVEHPERTFLPEPRGSLVHSKLRAIPSIRHRATGHDDRSAPCSHLYRRSTSDKKIDPKET